MNNLLKTITLPNGSILHIGGEGHTIVNSSDTVMTSRSKLKFKGQDITDDATNDTTVIEPEIKVVSTQEEWEQMTPQEKNNPNVTWLLPWKTNPDTNRHQIVNGNGTLFTDRAKLQIIGGYVEDDSENNTTKIYVWNALLTITTPSALLYGKTITIKKDGVTIGTVAFSAQGVASYSVHEIGTYKCYCDGYESDDISVEEEKAYSVVIRAGLDLHEWITAGSTTGYPLNPSSYADFSALEADEAAVRQLMTVHASVDYLATATAGDSLMEDVINSDVCAKWINLSDYALDTLSANSDIKSVMDTADKYGYGEWGITDSTTTPPTWGALGNVPIMTANNAPYGVASIYPAPFTGYEAYKAFDGDPTTSAGFADNTTSGSLTYKFANPTAVRRYAYNVSFGTPVDVTLQIAYSDDGTNFTNISGTQSYPSADNGMTKYFDIADNGYHMYWQINATFSGSRGQMAYVAQFYGRELKPLVPTMTANDKPKGHTYTSATDRDRSYYPFDGNTSTISDMYAGVSGNTPGWVSYEFAEDVNIKGIKTGFYSNGPSYFSNGTLSVEVSDDGNTWDEACKVFENATPASNTTSYYNAVSESNVKYIKWQGNGSSGWSQVGLAECQVFGFDYSEKEFAQGSTRKTIYDHGVELEEIEGIALGNGVGSKESDQLYVKDTSGAASGYYFATKNTIDFSNSNFSRLCAYNGNKLGAGEGSSAPNGAIAVNTIKSGFAIADPTAYKYMASANKVSEFPVTLDISSVNGNLYVVFFEYSGNSNRYGSCKEIWLE